MDLSLKGSWRLQVLYAFWEDKQLRFTFADPRLAHDVSGFPTTFLCFLQDSTNYLARCPYLFPVLHDFEDLHPKILPEYVMFGQNCQSSMVERDTGLAKLPYKKLGPGPKLPLYFLENPHL